MIVWKQIIRKAADTSKDVIFVSDDLKEDWMLEFRGKKYGPRKELIKEDKVFVSKYEKKVQLVCATREKFYNALRSKLNWSGGPHA